tara:strand:- start:2203 stop:2484 length:282 start_codon:yes stop_codon:yes gene_type:complete
MASCKFCLNNSVDTWFGNWCDKCHRLQRIIHLFTIDKVMSVLDNVLIVNDDVQEEKIKEELKCELTTREYKLRERKNKNKSKPLPTLVECDEK